MRVRLDACVALTGRWRDEQVNKLMEWRQKDRAEVKALLNFFVLVSLACEHMRAAHARITPYLMPPG